MRDRLIQILDAFNSDRITILEMRQQLLALLKNGLRDSIAPQEKKFLGNLVWCLDMYDPERQPRAGFAGHMKDFFARFKGDYRMTHEDIRRVVGEFQSCLNATSHPQSDDRTK